MSELSYRCGIADNPLIYATIGGVFDQVATAHPDRLGLIVRHQGIRWTYRQYREQVDRLASGLLKLGIDKGDRVGIWAPNCYEWCLTQFATAKIGALTVCINPAYRIYELDHALNAAQCKALVSAEQFKSTKYLELLTELAPELRDCAPGQLESVNLPHLKTIIRVGAEPSAGMFNFADVCEMGNAENYESLSDLRTSLSPDDPINIQFTSGTTGRPKGATLSHFNILNNAKVVGDGMHLDENDKLCIPVPLYHCFGMVMGSLACVTHAATAVLPGEGFEPLATLQTVAEEKCTALHGVPTMFIAIMEHQNFGEFDLSSLRTGIMAGSTCPMPVMQAAIDKMHMAEVLIAYGQTETSPVNHMTAIDDSLQKRVASVGRAGPHLEVKIIDQDNRVVPVGTRGEVCVRGYSVMQGYWDDAEQTAKTIDAAAWLHSGDIGVMDADGYVDIVGRLKDMIIRGGENIYPREVEEFLYNHPAIEEVQVIGVNDSKYGEQVCAHIKVRAGQELSEREVRDFCQDKIAHFKIPYYIKFVTDYPMTVTGKIQKFIMRQQTEDELGTFDKRANK